MKRVHFTGACGRAIGSLALALKAQGWSVTASDDVCYAPMSEVLRSGGLELVPSFDAANLPLDLDVLVNGSHIDPGNPEVKAARARQVPVMNLAAFLGNRVLADRGRLVVAGTNGKTTTTAMIAWILECAGWSPDYFFAGQCPQFERSVRIRGAEWAILEGDEYPAGREDPVPKFLHYRPDRLVLTNLAFDHAEIYRDLDSLTVHFRKLMAEVPANGEILIPEEDTVLSELAQGAVAPVVSVGRSDRADVRLMRPRPSQAGITFELAGLRVELRLPGLMNAMNATMAMRAATGIGVSAEIAAEALSEFRGVKGRLEVVMDSEAGTLILDEGYHPEAIRENLAALRQQYPGRRLVLALLPRFTGGKGGFQEKALPEVLEKCDGVLLAGLFDPVPTGDGPFSPEELATELARRGVKVEVLDSPSAIPPAVVGDWRAGDVTLCSLPPGHEAITDEIRACLGKGETL